jgi:hypothetical protein
MTISIIVKEGGGTWKMSFIGKIIKESGIRDWKRQAIRKDG